jgi:hypothetical protein
MEGKGSRRWPIYFVQMLPQDIFVELFFEGQWPQTRICHMFQRAMMIEITWGLLI